MPRRLAVNHKRKFQGKQEEASELTSTVLKTCKNVSVVRCWYI